MLRIWHRASAANRPWVGRLEHLPEGTVWTFDSPQAMLTQLLHLLETGSPVTTESTPRVSAAAGSHTNGAGPDAGSYVECVAERGEGIG